MVKDAVQDELDAPRLGLAASVWKVQGAKVWVYQEIVLGVVQVVGGRLKDRVQVDDGDAELLERIQLVDQPLEVAAVELVAVLIGAGAARIAQVLVPGQLAHRLAVDPVAALDGVVAISPLRKRSGKTW